jgi:hypothetical protein
MSFQFIPEMRKSLKPSWSNFSMLAPCFEYGLFPITLGSVDFQNMKLRWSLFSTWRGHSSLLLDVDEDSKQGAATNPTVIDMQVSWRNSVNLARSLICRQATKSDGRTALFYAAWTGKTETMEFILENVNLPRTRQMRRGKKLCILLAWMAIVKPWPYCCGLTTPLLSWKLAHILKVKRVNKTTIRICSILDWILANNAIKSVEMPYYALILPI